MTRWLLAVEPVVRTRAEVPVVELVAQCSTVLLLNRARKLSTQLAKVALALPAVPMLLQEMVSIPLCSLVKRKLLVTAVRPPRVEMQPTDSLVATLVNLVTQTISVDKKLFTVRAAVLLPIPLLQRLQPHREMVAVQ